MPAKHAVVVLGAGKIGRMVARLLHAADDYAVCVADADPAMLTRLAGVPGIDTALVDVADAARLDEVLSSAQTVISALSYQWNPAVAAAALRCGIDYFDLTEDIATTQAVRALADEARQGQIFVPQCGLAPGFVSIVAHELTRHFEHIDTVHMRVGALPQFPTGQFKYNLTWSTDGLINEYCNLCDVIYDGQRRLVLPLEGWEEFSLDGITYEAFNTSGGLGSLCETLEGRVRELDYKTIRYPGHRALAAFLWNELRLSADRPTLKRVLEASIPVTFQDVVVVFCSVTGLRRGTLVQLSDARKVYSAEHFGEMWSAIQLTTAAGVCAMVDLRRSGELTGQGWVKQESVSLPQFLGNRFGATYGRMA